MVTILTSTGLDWINQLSFGNTSYTTPNRWETGISSTAPSESDTTCTERVPYTYTVAEACDAIAGWNHGGDGQQCVLNTADEHLGTGCLNIPITYATGTSTWTKTLAAGIDLSAALTGMYLWFYVNDLTNITASSSAVIVTLGTGGVANSYDFYFNKTELTAASWICLRVPDMTAYDNANGGGATLNNVDTVRLTVKTTGDYTGTNLRMDEWVYATDAEHEKTCEASYPVISATNHTVKWQVKHSSANGNGFSLKRMFFKNTSDMGYLSGTYDTFDKTSAKELRFFVIQKLVNA